MPDVTVLMAVYNSAAYLRPAIDSILAQTHHDFEFVIVDDGSADDSVAICRDYTDPRIRLITLPANGGLAHALNAGLAEVRTELVARFDPDDLALPQRLATQRAVMLADPSLAAVGSQAIAITPAGVEMGTIRRSLAPESVRWSSLFSNPLIHPTVMFRASVVRDQLGGFRTQFDPYAQDYELWCRVLERHRMTNLPDRLVRHRVHASSIMGFQAGGAPRPATEPQFAAMMQDVLRQHVARLFGPGFLREDEQRVVPALILGLPASQLDAFLRVFERLLQRFAADQDIATPDFARTLARQFDALTVRVSPASRATTLRIYTHVLRRHAGAARYLSWTRTVALLLLGKRGRDRAAAWSRRHLPGVVD